MEDFFTFLALSILVRRMWLCLSISRSLSLEKDMLILRVCETDTDLEHMGIVLDGDVCEDVTMLWEAFMSCSIGCQLRRLHLKDLPVEGRDDCKLFTRPKCNATF